MIQHRLGVEFNDIGYRGSAPALQDALAGRVDTICDLSTTAPAQAQGGTPRPIIERLNAALRDALADPAMRTRFAGFGTEVFPVAEQTPEAANARLQAEIVAFRGTVRAMGVRPER